jgi:ABC-type polysaccharide/polyol phosphate export permease
MPLADKLRHIYLQKDLLKQLVLREVRGRYAGSSIGFYWSVINPLIMLVVYTYIFSAILKIRLGDEPGITDYGLYLFCGFLPWNAFQETVQRSTTVILDNASLIKNLSFPSKVLPLSIGLNALIHQLIGIAILVAVVGILLGFFPIHIWAVVPLMAFQLMFALGLGFILCTLHVYLRDTSQFVGVFLQIWMFGTPLFYPEKMIPGEFRFLVDFNPMAYIVRMFRDIFLKNGLPSLCDAAVFATVAVAFLLIGYAVYTRNFNRFVDQL